MNHNKLEQLKALSTLPKLSVSVQAEVNTLVKLGVMTLDEAVIMFSNN